MSSLYIRVMTGFYSHRKTAKLRSIIGDDAFWVVPRLWAYAAEHQPDGNFSTYDSAELANLLGCYKHATSMLQALKSSGYLDESGVIHDWHEHNGYHVTFAERAKKAAEARWGKKNPPTPPKEEKDIDKDSDKDIEHCYKQCLEHATSIYEAYPKKEAKKPALKAIQKAMKKEPWERLLELTKEYAAIVEHEEKQYIPMPATWFNQERYLDNEAVKIRLAEKGNAAVPTVLPTRPKTVFELTKIIEAKENLAKSIRNRFSYEAASGVEWSNDAKRQEYRTLKAEIKTLTEQLAKG